MAVALDQMVELAVSTAPTAQINVSHLKDLLYALAKHASAEQGLPLPASNSGTPVTAVDGADGESGEQGETTSSSTSADKTGSGDANNQRVLYALSNGQVEEMEKKLQSMEQRLSALHSLDELEKRASEGATPLSDMWNFTQLNQRLEAAEQGLSKVCTTVDQIAKELHNLRQSHDGITGSQDELNKKIAALSDNMSLLQGAESADASARSKLQEIEDAINKIKGDLDEKYVTCDDVDDLVTWTALENALKNRLPEPTSQQPAPQTPAKERVQSAKKVPSREAMEALQRVGALSGKHEQLVGEVGDLESALSDKLDASALSNMLPREALELLQEKLKQLEEEMNKNVLVEVGSLREALKALEEAAENAAALDGEKLNSILLSHEANENLVADMAGQLAQQRERLAELDRTLSVLQAAATKRPSSPKPSIDPEVLENMRSQLQEAQSMQDELTGHMNHAMKDIDVNSGRLQSLYDQVSTLNEIKADRDFVSLEVQEKADRNALQDKASRAWVDDHIHRLGEEVTAAKNMVVGTEEKLDSRVHQLSSEVDTKLDRLELEPLKNYLEGKIQTAIPKTVTVQGSGEPDERDAAGMRKALLRFRCISCDRPVYMKPEGPVPTLPIGQGMPPQRSIKAYTSYELEQIRQQQRLASGIPVDEDVMTSLRSCGGRYTSTTFLRRPARSVPPLMHPHSMYTVRDLHALGGNKEAEIVGQNGQVYRGRTGSKDKLPNLYSMGKSLPTTHSNHATRLPSRNGRSGGHGHTSPQPGLGPVPKTPGGTSGSQLIVK